MHYRITNADGSRAIGAVPAEHAAAARAEIIMGGLLPAGGSLELSPAPFPAIGSKDDVHERAQELLDASDQVIVRCAEHSVAVPQEWRDYRAALRTLAGTPTEGAAMPARPAFPAGT